MLSRLFQKKKLKRAKLYKDCSELPVIKFFRIVEDGNYNELIIEGEATSEVLEAKWESIMDEFQQLTSSGDYSMQIRKTTNDIRRVNRLNGLIALYYLATFGGQDISEELEYWNIKGNDANAIKLAIMRERTSLNIEQIEREKPKENQGDFHELWTAVENGLNRNIDVDNCSVKKWVSLCKSLEQKAKHYKKLSNERPDKS